MESLPTEILQVILGYLPVHERIRAERVCKRWRNASTERVWRDVQVLYIITSKLRKKYYDFEDSFKKFGKYIAMKNNRLYIGANELEIIQSLVSRAGQHVKKCIFEFRHDDPTKLSLAIIATHCHNIEKIQLYRIEYSDAEAFSSLLEVNKQLHSIACYYAHSIIDILPLKDWKSLSIEWLNDLRQEQNEEKVLALMENSPSLEKLYIVYWTPNIQAATSECKQLKNLRYSYWHNSLAEALVMDTSLLNRLTCFKAEGLDRNDRSITDILAHCINVESLTLSYGYDELPITVEQAVLALPKLESLELDAPSVTDKILSRLLKFKHLRLPYSSDSITEDGIFEMIIKSECLEKLDIPEVDVTTQLFEKLAQNVGERHEILTIEVSPKIYKEALEICRGSKISVIEAVDYFMSWMES